MKRLNQTESATFSILPLWDFFGNSDFLNFVLRHIANYVRQTARSRMACCREVTLSLSSNLQGDIATTRRTTTIETG
jgi:hypothetical protein